MLSKPWSTNDKFMIIASAYVKHTWWLEHEGDCVGVVTGFNSNSIIIPSTLHYLRHTADIHSPQNVYNWPIHAMADKQCLHQNLWCRQLRCRHSNIQAQAKASMPVSSTFHHNLNITTLNFTLHYHFRFKSYIISWFFQWLSNLPIIT